MGNFYSFKGRFGKVDTPLNKKLESVEWGEFRFSRLFKICTVKNKLTKFDLSVNGKTPVYSSESTNNGIIGYTNHKAEFIISDSNPIYVVFGDHTRSFNIATKSFCVMDNVKVLTIKEIISIKTLIFIVSSWKKCIPNKGYSRHWSLAKDILFNLPTKNNKIDFEFMESFITELEAEQISKLEVYLEASGLKNYILTNEEKQVLKDFENVNFEEFNIQDLFTKLNLRNNNKSFNKLDDTSLIRTDEFNLPLVNAKMGDNGIMFYGREKDFDSAEMTIDVISNGAIATGTVYAQPHKIGVLWDAYLLRPKVIDVSREKLLYLSSALEKSIKTKFGWDNKAVWSKVQHEVISLPTHNQQPNYKIMETFISAIQKLVIKDVVLYTDRKA